MALTPAPVTEILYFGCGSYPRRPRRWDEHLHAFHQLDICLGGTYALAVEGQRTFHSRRGAAIFVPPVVRHYHQTVHGFRLGLFKFHLAPGYWSLLGTQAFQARLPEALVRSVEAAWRAWEAKAPLHLEEAGAALLRCLVEVQRRRSGGVRRAAAAQPPADSFRATLWKLLAQVEAEPNGGWSVAGLAAACHLTPDHFARRFKAELREEPRAWLLHARMRAAANALAVNPDLTIKRAAEEAGYANVHAFSRAFRRALGESPAAFRRTPSGL